MSRYSGLNAENRQFVEYLREDGTFMQLQAFHGSKVNSDNDKNNKKKNKNDVHSVWGQVRMYHKPGKGVRNNCNSWLLTVTAVTVVVCITLYQSRHTNFVCVIARWRHY